MKLPQMKLPPLLSVHHGFHTVAYLLVALAEAANQQTEEFRNQTVDEELTLLSWLDSDSMFYSVKHIT